MAFFWGAVWWLQEVVSAGPGVVLGVCQAMVLVAIAVALATRVPMVVNMVSCLVVYFLGNLTPVLTESTRNQFPLVRFMAQLFDTILPRLEMFNLGHVLVRDVPPPSGPFAVYLGTVVGYAVLYTAIALLLGLVLFEDRDLA
jgi:hypothetical protein